ncbi:MAG: hypothetical protein MJ250_07810, partial [Alphaproteobacteria bacterium]|nr:hypothetical protein [Alphaproteobacteria bacterium]
YDVNDDTIDSIKKDMSKLNYKTIIERSSEEPKVQNAPKESLLQKSLKNIPERNDIKDCVAKYISKNRER